MKELELKYGCNPNQKPARVFMEDGELPIAVLNGARAISICWTRSTAGSLCGNSKRRSAFRRPLRSSM